jgi:ActR/RegA family two-component response regulator
VTEIVRSYDHRRVGDDCPTTGPAGMSGPLLVAVDDDPDLLRDVERELRNRYAADYRVRCVGSASEGRAMLQELAAAGEEVALVLAGEELSEASGTELLADVPSLFPHAQRVLLIGWGHLGDTDTGDAIFEAIARGRVDQYLVWPAPPPDEQFHQAVSSFLLAWAEARRRAPHTIDVVGETWSGRAYELREVLGRCAMPQPQSRAQQRRDAAEGDGQRHDRRGREVTAEIRDRLGGSTGRDDVRRGLGGEAGESPHAELAEVHQVGQQIEQCPDREHQRPHLCPRPAVPAHRTNVQASTIIATEATGPTVSRIAMFQAMSCCRSKKAT